MKKIVKILLGILVCTVSLATTFAYFYTHSQTINVFETEDYKFKINTNGGSFSNNNVVVENNTISFPNPVKKGYDFLGYSNSQDGNVIYPAASKIDVGLINNKLIHAIWDINTYDITYNLNGGTATNLKEKYTVEDSFSLVTPIKEDHTFLGWTGSNGLIPQSIVSINKGTFGNKNFLANWDKINAKATGVTIYAYRSQDYGNSYSQWANGPWEKYYTDSVRISDVGTWDLVVSNNYVELKGTTVVISDYRCYKLEVYAGNNGRNGEFLGFDTECTVNENHNTTSKAYLKVGW